MIIPKMHPGGNTLKMIGNPILTEFHILSLKFTLFRIFCSNKRKNRPRDQNMAFRQKSIQKR